MDQATPPTTDPAMVAIGPATGIDPATAIASAKASHFPNLCATGIQPRCHTGPPVDPAHVAAALAFLGRCRRTRRPSVHTIDLQHYVGVGPGAIIAAGIALDFDVRGWMGGQVYYPHAIMGVRKADVRKLWEARS